MSSRLMYGYRMMNGRVVHQKFDAEHFPSDWFDSPEKCRAAAGLDPIEPPTPEPAPVTGREPEFVPVKRKPGRPRKAA